MPNASTFAIRPIAEFVKRWMNVSGPVRIDPFARDNKWSTISNDLNPDTDAQYHMDAREFLMMIHDKGVTADIVFFDPPYSPRQITEVYASVGIKASSTDTQSGRFKRQVREGIEKISKPGTIVLSFGWNSVGMGANWVTHEIMLVSHGGDHNDTICMAQEKKDGRMYDDLSLAL